MKTQAVSPAIKTYQEYLSTIQKHALNEGAVRIAFQNLLAEWSKPHKLTVLGEQTIQSEKKTQIRLDGLLVDSYGVRRGYWEAKDSRDDLEVEIQKKIDKGYPLTNTIFEDTRRAVLYQNKQRVEPPFALDDAGQVERLLKLFVEYQPAHIEEFHRAVDEFTRRIPELVTTLSTLIDGAKVNNQAFRTALNNFLELCRSSLNKDTSAEQVEDMLKQHILTERIFRSIFSNPDFVNRNAVAVELEKVVRALTSRSFSRDTFLQSLNYFYSTIEQEAHTITDYREKQDILNNLYERFFQAYSTKSADTHGIVYTPAPIVRFMVASVQKALQDEFGKSLGAEGVHIIDPCVGTGTFMMELLQQIPRSQLEHKYQHELHANEVLLLPYYIASQNIEHAYLEQTGEYLPFEGICFADTLNLDNSIQMEMFAPENTERIKRQQKAQVFVVIGNPPYNVGQENENDNNKNRKYKIDDDVSKTYAKASRATNKNALSDPYVKFFRWATDRLGGRDGIVCYVSNNSFLNNVAFDGMRKQLLQDFDRIYTFDLGGNVRKNPKLSGTRHNVFGIQVGVCITLLVRNRGSQRERGLYYTRFDEFWTKFEKLEHLQKLGNYTDISWQQLTPDAKNNWLTEGMQVDFDSFLPIGSKEAKAGKVGSEETIFDTYSSGVKTNRDDWAYSFSKIELERKIKLFIETYNTEVDRWSRRGTDNTAVDNFVLYDDKKMKWSRDLKLDLQRKKYAKYEPEKVRHSLYRPFCKEFLFFDRILNEEVYVFPSIFPTAQSEQENSVICVSSIGHRAPFTILLTNLIPNLTINATDGFQCFPFYVYAEDGSNRRENITDYALQKFREQYANENISKWDIFYYVYAVLHSPEYRSRYAENLKRDLPRIPFVAPEAWAAYVQAGEKLAKLHRDYEQAHGYSLGRQENPNAPLDWKVDERGMRLSPDKTSLRYNHFLTLTGIPAEAFEYKLGNRSALEWVIDQYKVSEDARSGLRHDPNNPDEPQYIVKLVEKVVQVSVDTLAIIKSLPPLA